MMHKAEPNQALLESVVAVLATIVFMVLIATCAPAARADCVWIPVCIPAHDPPIDAMRVYLDGQLAHEYRPMWAASGGRTNIWLCGRAAGVVSMSVVRGDVESDRTLMREVDEDDPTLDKRTCTGGRDVFGSRTLGSNYGPIEQLLRAIARNQAGDPRPIDTDRDGTIRPHDRAMLERTARREFPDYTGRICSADVCP